MTESFTLSLTFRYLPILIATSNQERYSYDLRRQKVLLFLSLFAIFQSSFEQPAIKKGILCRDARTLISYEYCLHYLHVDFLFDYCCVLFYSVFQLTNGMGIGEKSWMGCHFIVLEVPTSTSQLATQPDCLMMNTKLIIGETFAIQLFLICYFLICYFLSLCGEEKNCLRFKPVR